MKRNLLFVAVLLIAALAIIACRGSATPTAVPPTSAPAAQPTTSAGIPNPASVYCEQSGGKLDLRHDAQSGTFGVCVFPDKSECDEWAFYRGTCKPGDKPGTK